MQFIEVYSNVKSKTVGLSKIITELKIAPLINTRKSRNTYCVICDLQIFVFTERLLRLGMSYRVEEAYF